MPAPLSDPLRGATHRVHPEPSGVTDRTLLLNQDDLDVVDVLYWPSVLPTHAIDGLTDPLGAYYLYYSASHADSAIRLAYADEPLGPYTDYGRIFKDPEAGPQTETPEVIWNPDTQQLHLYYHGILGDNQSTALALSTDGIEWDKHDIVIEAPPNTPKSIHTGYLRVHRFGDYWLGHHLFGGDGRSGFGVSYSADGIEWRTDPRRLSNSLDVTGDTELRMCWHETQLVQRDGRYWWIGSQRPTDPWGSDDRGFVSYAPLADERSVLGPPRRLLESTLEWEGLKIYTPDVLVEDNEMYIFYGTLSGSTHGGGAAPTTGHIGGGRITWTDTNEPGGEM